MIGSHRQGSHLFKKTAYFHPDYPNRVLLHYFGDPTAATEWTHANAVTPRAKATAHTVTRKSVLNKIRNATDGTSKQIYRKLVAAAPLDVHLHDEAAPKNPKQVANTKYNDKMKKELLTHDEMWNLYMLHRESNAIKIFSCIPSTRVVLLSDKILEKILETLDDPDLPAQCLGYDPTYNVGNYFVSQLTARATDLVGERGVSPCVVLASFYHTEMTTSDHDEFWYYMKNIFPELNEAKKAVIATDEEAAINNAIKRHFPKLARVRCRNHVWDNCKRKLGEIGVRSRQEQQLYKNQLETLFNQESVNAYNELLHKTIRCWKQPFQDYYYNNIHNNINSIGSWTSRKFGVERATTNATESMHRVLKSLNDWKEVRIDHCARSFIMYDAYQSNEYTRGRYGKGEWRLVSEMAGKYDVKRDRPQLQQTTDWSEIVSNLRGSIGKITKRIEEIASSELKDSPETFSTETIDRLTSHDMALQAVNDDRVRLQAKFGTFLVQGFTAVRTVRLYPKPAKCSCDYGSSGECYHIAACEIAINQTPTERVNKRKITELSRAGKRKSGRKGNGKGKRPPLKKQRQNLKTDGEKKVDEEKEMMEGPRHVRYIFYL
jgi:hypothetical protein